MNKYNETEDGLKWPVILMDLSKQNVGDANRMIPLRSTLSVCEGTKPITNAMQLQWGGLKGETLMTLKEWEITCRKRCKEFLLDPLRHPVWKLRLENAEQQLQRYENK